MKMKIIATLIFFFGGILYYMLSVENNPVYEKVKTSQNYQGKHISIESQAKTESKTENRIVNLPKDNMPLKSEGRGMLRSNNGVIYNFNPDLPENNRVYIGNDGSQIINHPDQGKVYIPPILKVE